MWLRSSLADTLGYLAGDVVGAAKAVQNRKKRDKRLKEMIRHNSAIEGKGVFKSPVERVS